LSKTEEFGLRFMVQLARIGAGERLGLKELSALEGMSHENAARHMRLLRDGGFVDSRIGRKGGYRLARSSEHINVWEVLVALDGAPWTPDECRRRSGVLETCVRAGDRCTLRPLWQQLTDVTRELLERVTLADLAREPQRARISFTPIWTEPATPEEETADGISAQELQGDPPMTRIDEPSHVVAVVGGSSAGSTVAEVLADHGCRVVVFDQNPRPYGKIEDGLPRWHSKHRNREYGEIDVRLDRTEVTFVPSTRLGEDVDFADLAGGWGFSAVVLANGAWKDRALAIPGADPIPEQGLVYQNPLIHWFNHKDEPDYDGPRYEIPDGTVVVGGGLASIDVMKIVQIELYQRALRRMGFHVSMLEMEKKGIPRVCLERGIVDPWSLGVTGGLLVYRRRVEDMPLTSLPANASDKAKARLPTIRKKVLDKVMKKFLFRFQPQRVPTELVVRRGRVTGIRIQATELIDGRPAPVDGSEETVTTRLVISSIGSIPEPLPGIEMDGIYYRFEDWETGRYAPLPNVFAAGNVITGQGNIKVSNKHGRHVGEHLAETYLLGDGGERDISDGTARGRDNASKHASMVAEVLAGTPKLSPEEATGVLARAEARGREVGYDGDYVSWILAHTVQVDG